MKFSRNNPIVNLARVLCLTALAVSLPALIQAQTVNLAWNANTEADLAGYVVVYGTQSGTYGSSVTLGKVTTYTVTGLAASTRYYFAVKAVNTSGLVSPTSNEVSYTTPAPPVTSITLASVTPASGPKTGGTVITLIGTNFVSGVRVNVGSTAATGVTRVSSTEVRATTPAGTVGAKSVTVINPDNSSATKANAFTYVETAAPRLTSVSPTSGPRVGGYVMTLTGQSFVSGARVKIGSLSATNVTRVSSTQLRATVPYSSTSGLRSVTVTNPDGQSATLPDAFRYNRRYWAGAEDTETEATSETDDLADGPDTDGDGLPDAWETAWGLDAKSSAGDDGAAGDPDRDSVANSEELELGTHPRGFVTRYFAEGVVNSFFDTRFALANPGAEPAHVRLEFEDLAGALSHHDLVLQPRSRATVVARDTVAVSDTSFSTRVESDQEIVADRLVRWDSTSYGAHAETAVTAPATTWYFAEGATHGPYELFYLLQNPTEQAADVEVRYLRSGNHAPIVKTYPVAPHSRATVHVDAEGPGLDAADVAAVITSTNAVPIVAERSMYFNGRIPFEGGTASAGVTAPSTQWYLAEGATGSFFSMFLLIANPEAQDAQVHVSYLLTGDARREQTYTVKANSRLTVNVNDEPQLADAIVASQIQSDVPVIVERTMWWPGRPNQWTEGHNSFGATATGTRWAVAEGEAGGAEEATTFVLVANTSAFDGEAKVTLLFEDGPEVSRTVPLRANSRTTVAMDGPFAIAQGRRFSTIVESLGDTPAQIVVESAMYSNAGGQAWSAGSNTLGTKLP